MEEEELRVSALHFTKLSPANDRLVMLPQKTPQIRPGEDQLSFRVGGAKCRKMEMCAEVLEQAWMAAFVAG
jgi:hypothetical protein|tara:strand:- start:174 stop:386 length:213 start_codon:yes stop_codon:yes gene_type:complete